jgi:hypothetical protein
MSFFEPQTISFFEEEPPKPKVHRPTTTIDQHFAQIEKQTIEFVNEWLQREYKTKNIPKQKIEKFLDSLFYSHSVRQAAISRKQQTNNVKKVNIRELPLDEKHLKFCIQYLNQFHRLQHAYAEKFTKTLTETLQEYFNIDSHATKSNDTKQHGITVHQLVYELLQQFAPKNDYVLAANRLTRFLRMYPDVFNVFKYTTHTEFVVLKQAQGRPLPDSQLRYPSYISLPETSELNDQHVLLIRDKILIDHAYEQSRRGSYTNTDMPLSALKTVLHDEYNIIPNQIYSFLERHSEHFQLTKKKSMRSDYSYVLVKRLVPLEQQQEEQEELPSFELPKDYKIICTSDTEVAAKWIEDKILNAETTGDDIIVGMDSEWDVARPLLSLQINPHVAFQWKQKTEFALRDHYHPPLMDTLQIAIEDECLIIQLLHRPCDERLYYILMEFMASDDILKCWCSMASDIDRLRTWLSTFEHHSASRYEMSWKQCLVELDKDCKGAPALCKTELGREMRKDYSMQLSRWSREILDEKQKEYAAMDAYLNYRLYFALEHNKEQNQPTSGTHVQEERNDTSGETDSNTSGSEW